MAKYTYKQVELRHEQPTTGWARIANGECEGGWRLHSIFKPDGQPFTYVLFEKELPEVKDD